MIDRREIALLRGVAKRVAELAGSDGNREKERLWTRLTDLNRDVRPLLLTHLWNLAWEEILPEASLQCRDAMARAWERDLKRRIWLAETLDDDGVIEPVVHYALAFHLDCFPGLDVRKVYAAHDHGRTGAAAFVPAIVEKRDVEKLGEPVLSVDEEACRRSKEQALEIFSPILDVVKWPHYFAAKVVDEFSWLRGIEALYRDMVEDPHWTHEALQRIADNFGARFRLMEEAGVWGIAEGSQPLGSTGLCFNPDIPTYRTAGDPAEFRPKLAESWGFTCSEALTCVSPAMHDEFAFEYDRQLMGLFRYVNVGCCETLDHKASLLRSVPNVRRISISEWCDLERAAESVGADCVYGYKPSGVPFVQEPFAVDEVRREIARCLDAAAGCPLEIVLNIGGTLGPGDPAAKLVEWNRVAKEEILEAC